jgi:hypothetical protein
MRYLKSILIALVATLAILFGVSFFLPSHYTIEKKMVIQADPEKIYNQVCDLHQWHNWSAWNERKYNSIELFYEGQPKEIGSTMKWKADGDEGKVTLTGLVPFQSTLFNVTMEESWVAQGKFDLVKKEVGTEVKWIMKGDVGNNFIGRYFVLFADQFISSDMQIGLENLKKICEKD